jgi:hypothetical protein
LGLDLTRTELGAAYRRVVDDVFAHRGVRADDVEKIGIHCRRQHQCASLGVGFAASDRAVLPDLQTVQTVNHDAVGTASAIGVAWYRCEVGIGVTVAVPIAVSIHVAIDV